MENFKHYGELSAYLFDKMGLKVETVYIQDGQYSPHAVYINRIANYNRARFRVLIPGKDKVKNCIKITYNPDIWDNNGVRILVNSRLPYFSRLAMGSCHKYIRHETVKEVLTGVYPMQLKHNFETVKSILL